MYREKLITKIHRHRFLKEHEEKILQAYDFAEDAHEGQLRHTGEPYIVHPLAVAIQTADWGLDATTVIASLLHDIVEDTSHTLDEVKRLFGDDVAFIVDGVTKIGQRVRYQGNQSQADTLKKMILALSRDIRVVFVKLADRLHNMQTLDAVPIAKQRRIALETNEIYAPLAYRIGMATLSGDLEDLAFPYLHPRENKWLSTAIQEHLAEGEEYLSRVKEVVSKELHHHRIKYQRIDTRAKRISSLYKKLKRVSMDLNQVYDLVAVRIIVPNISSCYAALGVIHSLWPPLPGKIKDYIALPKPNGYRSLHTTVFCLDKKLTEFQIRTEEMHNENEYGLAAYWAYQQSKGSKRYEEGSRVTFARHSELDILNQIKKWQESFVETKEIIESLKIDLFSDRIFVLTPDGEVIDLPEGSTPIDFAYEIHSDVGNTCVGARVNDKLVALDRPLEDGDVIEIVTQKNKLPNKSWLAIVKTSKAKTRIRAALRQAEGEDDKQPITYTITARDRLGLMKDISAVFSQQKTNIVSIVSRPVRGSQFTTVKISAEITNLDKAEKILLKIKSLKNIREVSYKK